MLFENIDQGNEATPGKYRSNKLLFFQEILFSNLQTSRHSGRNAPPDEYARFTVLSVFLFLKYYKHAWHTITSKMLSKDIND